MCSHMVAVKNNICYQVNHFIKIYFRLLFSKFKNGGFHIYSFSKTPVCNKLIDIKEYDNIQYVFVLDMFFVLFYSVVFFVVSLINIYFQTMAGLQVNTFMNYVVTVAIKDLNIR